MFIFLNKFKQTKRINSALFIFVVLVSFSFANSVFGWTAPTVTAPGGNRPTPLNVGGTEQTRTGNFIIDPGNLIIRGNAILSGNVSLSLPSAGINEGDVLGISHLEGYNDLYLWGNNTETAPIYLSGSAIEFYTGQTKRLSIIADGKVGIGTLTPAYTLDVAGDINLTGSLTVNGTDFATGYWTQTGSDVYYNSGAVYNQIDSGGFFTGADDDLRIYHNGTNGIIYNSTGSLYVHSSSNIYMKPAATEVGIWSSSGLTMTSGKVISSADEATTHYLGRAQIGFYTGGADDMAYFGHRDMTFASYAVRQSSTGLTYINALTGKNIWLRINNSTVADIGSTGLTMAANKNIALSGTGTIGVGGTDTDYKITTTVGGIKAESTTAGNAAGYFNNSEANGYGLLVNDGIVGIGTITPSTSYKLEVVGNTNIQGNLTVTGTLSGSGLWTSTGVSDIYYNPGSGNGYVGIGTTSPTEKLNVVGGNIKVDAANRQIGYWDSEDSTHSGYLLPYDSSGFVNLVSTFATGGILFKTGNSATERMRIDGSGLTIADGKSISFDDAGANDTALSAGVSGLKIATVSGYGEFGARNSSWFHMYTDRTQGFYFYQPATFGADKGITMSGTAAFTTGTGAVSINGVTSFAAVDVNFSGGTDYKVDSDGDGFFKDVTIHGGDIIGPNDNNLLLRSDTNLYFDIDEDETTAPGDNLWYWRNGANVLAMQLTESGILTLGEAVSNHGDLRLGSGSIGYASLRLDATEMFRFYSSIMQPQKDVGIGTHYIRYSSAGASARLGMDLTTTYLYDSALEVREGTFKVENAISTGQFIQKLGAPLAINEWVGLGFEGYVAGTSAVKSAIVHKRTGNYGIGEMHFLIDTDENDSDAVLSDSVMSISSTGLTMAAGKGITFEGGYIGGQWMVSPITPNTGSTAGWIKIGQLDGLAASVALRIEGTSGYGGNQTGATYGQITVGSADESFGGYYYNIGPDSTPGVKLQYIRIGARTLDCYVYLGTYFSGSVEIVNGYNFTLNSTASTVLTGLTGLTDLTEEFKVNGSLSTGATDQLELSHNGTDAYFKTTDGAFYFKTDEGINTDTWLKIQAKGTGASLVSGLQLISAGGNSFQFKMTDGGQDIHSSWGDIDITSGSGKYVNLNNVLYAEIDGNVGIGVASPLSPLHVVGNVEIASSGVTVDTDSYAVFGVTRANEGVNNSYIGMTKSGSFPWGIGIGTGTNLIMGAAVSSPAQTITNPLLELTSVGNLSIDGGLTATKGYFSDDIHLTEPNQLVNFERTDGASVGFIGVDSSDDRMTFGVSGAAGTSVEIRSGVGNIYFANNTNGDVAQLGIDGSLQLDGNLTVDGSLDIGMIKREYHSTSFIKYENVAYYNSAGGNGDGALVINLPGAPQSLMWSMKLFIFNYATRMSAEVLLSGYTYSYTTEGWNTNAAFNAEVIGGKLPCTNIVRLAKKISDDSLVIVVGDYADVDVWDYTRVSISELHLMHNPDAYDVESNPPIITLDATSASYLTDYTHDFQKNITGNTIVQGVDSGYALTLTGTVGGDGIKINTADILGNNAFVWNQGTDEMVNFYSDTGNDAKMIMKDSGVTKIALQTDNVSYFLGGAVGIGTASPEAVLSVDNYNAYQLSTLATSISTANAFRIRGRNTAVATMVMSSINTLDYGIQAVNDAGTEGTDIVLNPFGGNIGIGTTDPAGKLHINDGVVIIDKDYGIRGDAYNAGARNYIYGLSNSYPDRGISYFEGSPDYISIHPGSITSVLAVTDTGRVGIGTTNPGAALVINNGDYPTVRVENDDPGEEAGIRFRARNTADTDWLHADLAVYNGTAGSGFFGIKVPYNGTAGSGYDFVVEENGRVGIGTTSPDNKLQIVTTTGAVWQYNDFPANTIALELGESGTTKVGAIKMWGYAAGEYVFMRPSNGNFHIDSTEGNYYFNWDDAITGKDGNLRIGNAAGSETIKLSTNGDSYFNGGNVGIGDSTPSAKLEVNGKIIVGYEGVAGNYSSTRVAGIWSIGTDYNVNTTNFGDQYGLVYAHTNVGTGDTNQPKANYGHQIAFTDAGVRRAVISLDYGHAWFQGNMEIDGTVSAGGPTGTSYGDHEADVGFVRIDQYSTTERQIFVHPSGYSLRMVYDSNGGTLGAAKLCAGGQTSGYLDVAKNQSSAVVSVNNWKCWTLDTPDVFVIEAHMRSYEFGFVFHGYSTSSGGLHGLIIYWH